MTRCGGESPVIVAEGDEFIVKVGGVKVVAVVVCSVVKSESLPTWVERKGKTQSAMGRRVMAW